MAKSMKGAGGFSQMPKMMTDEPSVILKLKKGGHVHMKHKKEEHGHKTMEHHLGGGMAGNALRAMVPALAGAAPMKPSLAMRRKAMATPMMKKGGDVAQDKAMIKKAFKEHDAQEHKGGKGTKLTLKHGGKAHHKFAKGGSVGDGLAKKLDKFETKTTIENDEKPYVNTEMHEAKRDRVHGTGAVKEGNAGGYKHGGKVHHKHGGKVHHISGHPEGSVEHHKHMAKHHSKMHKEGGSAHHKKMMEHHKALCKGGKYATGGSVPAETNESETKGRIVMGGTVEGNEHDFENTLVHQGRRDTAHGTGGVAMANAGGYKHGGKAHHKHGGKHHYAHGGHVLGAEDNVTTTPKGKTHTKTGEVMESNAGGYKHGGHAVKKHYATGGAVNKQGSAVVMPQARKPASKPVHINELSGTFKKGGRVKKFADGTDAQDLSRGGYDSVAKQETADNIAMRNMILNPIRKGYSMVKNAIGMGTPPAGSVTKTEKSVTVTPQKKRGGSIKR
jgi:hypothetical protein